MPFDRDILEKSIIHMTRDDTFNNSVFDGIDNFDYFNDLKERMSKDHSK